jgi:hypothetical protein
MKNICTTDDTMRELSIGELDQVAGGDLLNFSFSLAGSVDIFLGGFNSAFQGPSVLLGPSDFGVDFGAPSVFAAPSVFGAPSAGNVFVGFA